MTQLPFGLLTAGCCRFEQENVRYLPCSACYPDTEWVKSAKYKGFSSINNEDFAVSFHLRYIWWCIISHKRIQIISKQQQIQKGILSNVLLWQGDVEAFLDSLPEEGLFDLVITSPPYNIGKPYEQPTEIEDYLIWQERVIRKSVARLKDTGSICWQTGNFVQKGSSGKESEIFPLDILFFDIFRKHGLKLRNRIIWHFGHGLHCKYRFSGRYETVLWFTKTDNYYFDLDAVRIDPKYPGKKHFKGPRAGQYSCNPKGKNPEDVWVIDEEMLTIWDEPVWNIPNVKSNHVEKTIHPCQFPVALVDRFIYSLVPENGIVFDPFAGVGTAGVASLVCGRKFWGCEIEKEYISVAKKRIEEASNGQARYRPFNKPIYDHTKSGLSRKPIR